MPSPYTYKYDRSWVSTYVGCTIEIRLDGNPSTGYTWIRDPFLGNNILSDENLDVHSSFVRDPASKGTVGVGGFFKILVKPKKRGDHALRLVYCRPFDGAGLYDKRFALFFSVS
ncbi:inhibitor of cysteine peptidase [Leishmania tarentolae]|uniref:Inhibitor of cysteine peptidase n=1 Tax=Leishmania tarentolae TaxID=5689 RepID=A0A640KH27_LEITA|nr:inhibitor of cysteine peptidase [Leishmania tarentolae]